MSISAAGMLSGLDVNGLVTSLMSVEQQPLQNLQSKQNSFNSKLSAFGTLKSAVSTFQTAVKNVSGDALSALTATSSKTDILTASAAKGSGATAGTYSIEVSKLAQADKLVSSGVDSGTVFKPAEGTLSISVAGKAVPITFSDGNLASLSNAINKANAGVTATILNDGTKDRLVITGNNTGKDNKVAIVGTGTLSGFNTASMTSAQGAQNAEMTIDGVPVSKPSNTVTDAIKGVTLNLAQTNAGSPVKVSLAKDTTAVTKSVTDFVDAYNTLATAVNKQTSYNAATKSGAVLNGDASARSILTNIRAELGKGMSGAGGLSTLSDIGIAFQRDGTLKLEKPDKLKSAIETNFTGVSSLFSAPDGVGTRLAKVTEEMLGSKGVFKSRTDGLNATISSMDKSKERMSLQLAQTEKRYRSQFNALDTMMVNMQSMNSYLTQQLAALAANA